LTQSQATALPATGSRKRVPALDGVRGIAILAVMLHHLFHAPLLWMGVDLFFVLSGFLITTILLREKEHGFGRYIGHFYQRRAQRILPPYLLILLICIAIYGAHQFRYWYLYVGGMNFLNTLNLTRVDALPLWSLAVEEQFYFVWPLIVFLLPRKQIMYVSVALIFLAPVLRYLCTPLFHNPWAIYMLLPFRMDTLAAGSLAALGWPRFRQEHNAHQNLRRRLKIAAPFLGVTGFAVCVGLARHGITAYYATPIGNVVLYEATLVVVLSVFGSALLGSIPSFFAWRPFIWFGTLSYTIYLVHLVTFEQVKRVIHSPAAPFAAIAITLIYAMASWRYLEQPILRMGRPDDKDLTKALRAV